MEKQLKCVLLLSLQEMALRRLAVLLWSGSDILASISKFQSYGSYDEIMKKWLETIEGKVQDKMLKLELPECLTKQMIDIVKPIGLQLKRRKEFLDDDLNDMSQEISLPDSAKLCWTTAGTIDYRKTAEELVRCGELDVHQRYKIACIYCLEDYIPLLWKELPEKMKDIYGKAKYQHLDLSFCWPHILKGELSKLDYLLRTFDRNLTTFNQWAFEYSAENYYKTATEYFFQKLTHEEREASLMRTVEAVVRDRFRPESTYLFFFRNEILCYLLSVMTPEQQMEIVKARPIDVFSCFLVWPLQGLFLENAGLIWTFLPPSSYDGLLQKMADRFEMSYHYFPKLFQEFFMQSPLDFKKYFVDEESEFDVTNAYRFLSIFFRSQDSESIEIIFRNVDATDRVKLVFKDDLGLFYESILMDRWHMVVVCLREAALSKEDRKRWKEALMKCLINDIERIKWKKGKLKRFFEFLDKTDASADMERTLRSVS
ncbi:hypothetical protein AVEN_176983-1 [Araneus ventricosus]|uniref:Uncharacterized protein n=1 Tax=Araneus ventricosus TaxID=182803 RepID=A0A4Y2PHB6_ARAVE|nr:hypothetical protein AVEN_176983-1 [Araneus ventricosus]